MLFSDSSRWMNEHGVLVEWLLLRKLCFIATLSTINPAWTSVALDQGLPAEWSALNPLWQGWWYFCGRLQKPSINFAEIYPRAHGNFEEKNKVLESSVIIINYCVIITDALYN